MNPRFKGLGFVLLLAPVMLYIPIRAIAGGWVEEHRNLALFITLSISGALISMIAAFQDRKIGISIWSLRAWTSSLMESQHICFHLPLRLFGLLLIVASISVVFLV